MDSKDLHIFFLPFLAPGHMIPMLDMARLFAERGVKTTIITTTANAGRVRPYINRANTNLQISPINLLLIRFPSSEVGLPDGHENLTEFPNPDVTPQLVEAINMLQPTLCHLVEDHQPDCIISDVFYPWSVDLGIPRIAFHGTSFFSAVVSGFISRMNLSEAAVDDQEEPFVLPGLPHRIELTRAKIPAMILGSDDMKDKMRASHRRSFGMVMNSLYEMEPDYANILRASVEKVWTVGPVSFCNRQELDDAARGQESSVDVRNCLAWLDSKKPGSVLYVCFGSLGKMTPAQLTEIAAGLEASGHPFIWALKEGGDAIEGSPEGNRMVISGWAPQVPILNHKAVGGFLTHCGWNSTLESICAGVPMITWPLFAEQSFNERLVIDVLGAGIAVGVKQCSSKENERVLVKREEITKAVEELMGSGEEADGRRRRAKELGEMARRAVQEGGSSYNDLTKLIEDLMSLKAKKASDGK